MKNPGPFSRSAVNFNAGCKTAVSNIVMALAVMVTLLFLTPLFHYTPLVVLSSIIISAMLGLIDYEAAIHLWNVDKFDFIVCISAYVGVVFASVEMGLVIAVYSSSVFFDYLMWEFFKFREIKQIIYTNLAICENAQVAISLLRVLLFVARPRTFILGNIPNSNIYRNVEQYPNASTVPGVLVLEIDAPIFFANSAYLRERYIYFYFAKASYTYSNFTGDCELTEGIQCRISRWIDEEEDRLKSSAEASLQYVILDMGGKCMKMPFLLERVIAKATQIHSGFMLHLFIFWQLLGTLTPVESACLRKLRKLLIEESSRYINFLNLII